MSYKLTLSDDTDEMSFELLEVPIIDADIEGASDNTTFDGNVYTDFMWIKKRYEQSWSFMENDKYQQLRGFYIRQFENAEYPYLTIEDYATGIPITLVDGKAVRLTLTDGGVIDNCSRRQNVKITMRESEQL